MAAKEVVIGSKIEDPETTTEMIEKKVVDQLEAKIDHLEEVKTDPSEVVQEAVLEAEDTREMLKIHTTDLENSEEAEVVVVTIDHYSEEVKIVHLEDHVEVIEDSVDSLLEWLQEVAISQEEVDSEEEIEETSMIDLGNMKTDPDHNITTDQENSMTDQDNSMTDPENTQIDLSVSQEKAAAEVASEVEVKTDPSAEVKTDHSVEAKIDHSVEVKTDHTEEVLKEEEES